jgi:AAA domain
MESDLLEHSVGAESSLPNDIARVFTKPPPQSDHAKPRKKPRSRFGGLSPSEGATLPLTYWNDDETLPRSNMGGCVGFLVGQYGSHKTGTAIMLALDAIEQHGARVLFIAAEDANGVAKTRLPAACKARGRPLADIDAHWRTETETFDLLSDTDRAELIEAYREFAPDLIFIDVLTRVVTADINAPETGMRVMQSAYALAAPFGATVVIAHHPGLSGSGRPMGSSLFMSLADFCLTAKHKYGVVSTYVEKMKNGPDGFTVRYKTEFVALETDEMGLSTEAPTVRAMTAAEVDEHKAKRPPRPDVAAENATDAAAIAKLERDAPDVLKALRKITKPTLLREIAPMLDATADGADEKDEEKGTPLNSRIRRLNRLIGTPTSPGILAPFTAPRTGGRTSPHRLIPIPPPTMEEGLDTENEPSDAPAS